jgi:deoxyadenosine/deoxycytidine kinase
LGSISCKRIDTGDGRRVNVAPSKKPSKAVQKMINEMNLSVGRRIKADRKERFDAVLKKERFETYEDVYNFVMGLTKFQQLTLACRAVVYGGDSPEQLKKSFEKKKVPNEG